MTAPNDPPLPEVRPRALPGKRAKAFFQDISLSSPYSHEKVVVQSARAWQLNYEVTYIGLTTSTATALSD